MTKRKKPEPRHDFKEWDVVIVENPFSSFGDVRTARVDRVTATMVIVEGRKYRAPDFILGDRWNRSRIRRPHPGELESIAAAERRQKDERLLQRVDVKALTDDQLAAALRAVGYRRLTKSGPWEKADAGAADAADGDLDRAKEGRP